MYGFITTFSCGHPLSTETDGWLVECNSRASEHNPVCYFLSLLAVATNTLCLQSTTISTVSVYETSPWVLADLEARGRLPWPLKPHTGFALSPTDLHVKEIEYRRGDARNGRADTQLL